MSIRDELEEAMGGEAAQPDRKEAPAEESFVEKHLGPGTPVGSAIQGFGEGVSLDFLDELKGAVGAQGEAAAALREGIGLEAKTSDKSLLQRVLDAYRRERGLGRQDVDKSEQKEPIITGATKLAGALAVPVPKLAPMAKGATALQRMVKMGAAGAPIGAAFGLGNSDADLTKGEFGEALKDTAVSGGVSTLAGAAFGGALHKPLSALEGKERAAIDKAQSMAMEALDKPQRQAQGALGGRIQAGHRDIEAATAGASDSMVDPALQRELSALLASPEGIALRNRVLQGKAAGLPGKLGEIEEAQRVFDAAKAANTPEAVEREAARLLGPERFRDATMMRLKKYAGRTLIPAGAATIGAAIGGPEGAAVGGLLGGGLASVVGNPGTALANYMRDPAVAVRLAQLGQSPATSQAPAKVAASLTSDEEQRRRLLELLAKGR